jgi:hypothetical protein
MTTTTRIWDFANGFELRNRKGKNGSWRKSLQVRMTALRERSPLRVRIQFPPFPSKASLDNLLVRVALRLRKAEHSGLIRH